MKNIFPTVLILVVFLVSCAGTINIHNARKYDLAAYDALQKGDWKTARMFYSRAWGNAKMGNADIRTVSRLRYEYGRASGIVCEWTEAELALNEAFELDSKSNGPRWMPLVELERICIAQKNYIKAKGYFDKLMPILSEIQAETKDPIGYADLLDEYALVLENTGEPEAATKHRQRAKQITKTFPGKHAHTEITPYGTACNN
ncbi:hypothetical protein D1BOALGB6SA_2480 [Olavius sp. associated proteobacterium Delta 1]|nr:hypothetical protein D1BOALGB6SA_2480 [Olavius sp. associated proteobacterium Delta 1]